MTARSAVLSECGLYRYALYRFWNEGRRMATFIMLNPSIADADIDDPTIRRCVDFAKRWGYDGLSVANLYAYRATEPADLKRAARRGVDVVGRVNDSWLRMIASESALVVCAWGQLGPDRERARLVCSMLSPQYKLHALAYTKIDDQPRHPLMLKKDLIPLEYFT